MLHHRTIALAERAQHIAIKAANDAVRRNMRANWYGVYRRIYEDANRELQSRMTGITGYLFVFQPPLPVPEAVAVFVEGRSRSHCTKKFLRRVPALAKLRRRNPKQARQLMRLNESVQLTIVEQ